jgi:YD repeat-containing protein
MSEQVGGRRVVATETWQWDGIVRAQVGDTVYEWVDGRLVTEEEGGMLIAEYTWDGDQLAAYAERGAWFELTYDADGRLVESTGPFGLVERWTWSCP